MRWSQPGEVWTDWARAIVRQLGEFEAAQDRRPVGEVAEFRGQLPAGWLEANGASFSQASFPELAIQLGGTTLPTFTGRTGCVVGIKAT